MAKVLVVDDQQPIREALSMLLEANELDVVTAASADDAMACVQADDIGIVIQDMNFSPGATSGEEGAKLFRAMRELDPDLPVVLVTAWSSIELAVQLVKEGAADYLVKPWDDAKLITTLRNLLQLRVLRDENTRMRAAAARVRDDLGRNSRLCGLVYDSPRMHEVVSLAVRIAPADVPVLIRGPNGAGKELIAAIVQANSRRADAPFVKVNAGALMDELLAAELFGAEAGAYTGATKSRPGRFEQAHGGTLFLDEIGNLSLTGQARLLRVLQTREFERLGSNVTRHADVRVIAATNLDLRRAIAAGTFREDLYFRLAVVELRVPALRDRPEDVGVLARQYLASFAPTSSFSPQAVAALAAHDWPGNVRELENRVRRAALVKRGAVVTPEDLDLRADSAEPEADADPEERARIEAALSEAGGVVARAAAILGLSRQALYRRMERHGLTVKRVVR
ncbi:MAG: sigma-54-dependent transcriptional regulator [Kofleriaceae bacterium]